MLIMMSCLTFIHRYKLKFSADKVDIMIVQAIGLLDDLDKEINIYAMRVREWYGKFHGNLIVLRTLYIRTIHTYIQCLIRGMLIIT